MDNTFGQFFRVTSFGESHGHSVGVVLDGIPSGHKIDLAGIQEALNKRRPGQSTLVTSREEKDLVSCLSGLDVASGLTLGSPLCFVVKNADQKPKDYSELNQVYRPSHADFVTDVKYGLRASSGGGRSSARETIARVIAGAFARQMLAVFIPELAIHTFVKRIKDIEMPSDVEVDPALIESTAVRCPHPETAQRMIKLIEQTKAQGDSVGGIIACQIMNAPAGLGAPVFDKLHADLAKACMSIPAAKGFEVGDGFASVNLFGSEHNDAFKMDGDRKIRTTSNHSGGIQGGISNGEPITFQVAFKPTSTIFKPQNTVNSKGEEVTLNLNVGRHDPCVLPRAVPIVEAMAYIVIFDHWLRQAVVKLTRGSFND